MISKRHLATELEQQVTEFNWDESSPRSSLRPPRARNVSAIAAPVPARDGSQTKFVNEGLSPEANLCRNEQKNAVHMQFKNHQEALLDPNMPPHSRLP